MNSSGHGTAPDTAGIPSDPLEREHLFRGLLLGELPPARRKALELELFSDDAAAEELQASADDLIDAYLAGRLEPREQRRFETFFLASDRHRRRFEFVRDLRTAAGRVARRNGGARVRAPWLWLSAVAAALAAIAAAWLLSRPAPARDPVRAAALQPSPAAGPTAPTTGRVSAVTRLRLMATQAGLGAPVELALEAQARVVELAVPPPSEDAPSFAVSLRTISGKRVWRAADLVPRAADAPLVAAIPAELLSAGDYVLTVAAEAQRTAGQGAPREHRWTLRVTRTPGSGPAQPPSP